MAGEYSRELSVKVHAGQSRLASNGYYIGGAPGYGLRRFLVDQHGNRKMEMAPGQRKSLHTERTILIPGPPEEIDTIHRGYDLFLDKGKGLNEIARDLNARNLPNAIGRPWTWHSVRELLSNEKYAGTSSTTAPQRNWESIGDATHPANGSKSLGHSKRSCRGKIEKAQQKLKENASHYTENEMLDFLTAIWCREKHLSRDIIDASIGPCSNTLKQRFGSLMNAFNRIGFTSARLLNRETIATCARMFAGGFILMSPRPAEQSRDVLATTTNFASMAS